MNAPASLPPKQIAAMRVVSAPVPNNSRTMKVQVAWHNGDNAEHTYTLKVWSDAAFLDRLTPGATAPATIVDLRKEGAKTSDSFIDVWDGTPARAEKKKAAYAPRYELEAALAQMAGQIGAAAIASGKTTADAVQMFDALAPHVKTAARSIRP